MLEEKAAVIPDQLQVSKKDFEEFYNAQCPRCSLGIALNRTMSDQSQIVGFVILFTKRFVFESKQRREKLVFVILLL